MNVILNVAILVLGTVAALAAFGGDTWRKGGEALLKRVTPRGWIALLCMISTLALGVVKEILSDIAATESAAYQAALKHDLETATGDLKTTRAKLANLQAALAKQISEATSELPREVARLTVPVSGAREQSLDIKGGEFFPFSIGLQAGDILEYVNLCFAPTITESLTYQDQPNPARSLKLSVGGERYNLGRSGTFLLRTGRSPMYFVSLVNDINASGCEVQLRVKAKERFVGTSPFEKSLGALVESAASSSPRR
jgi:hypothetical protein